MNKLLKLRLDNDASKYIMSRMLGIDIGAYSVYEQIKYENIPCVIRQRIESLITDHSTLEDYYKRQEEMVENVDFDKLIKDAGLSIDKVAEFAGTTVEDATALVDDTVIFSDQESRDRLFNYMMYLYDISNKEQDEIVEQEEEKVDNNLYNESKISDLEKENHDLTVQLEWYEDIITCFVNLSNLVKEK